MSIFFVVTDPDTGTSERQWTETESGQASGNPPSSSTRSPSDEEPTSRMLVMGAITIAAGGAVGFSAAVAVIVLALVVDPLVYLVIVAPVIGGGVAGYFRGIDSGRCAITGPGAGALSSLPVGLPLGALVFFAALWVPWDSFYQAIAVSGLFGLVVVLVGLGIGAVLGLVGSLVGAVVRDLDVLLE